MSTTKRYLSKSVHVVLFDVRGWNRSVTRIDFTHTNPLNTDFNLDTLE